MSLKKLHNLRNTLLFRLTFLYAMVFVLSTAATFSIFYYRIYQVTMENLDEELAVDVNALAEKAQTGGVAAIQTAIIQESEPEESSEEFYRLITPQGSVLSATDMSSWGPIDTGPLPDYQANEVEMAYQTRKIPGQEYKTRIVTARIAPDMVLQIGETLEDADDYLEIFRTLFAILLMILVVVAVLIGRFIARRALADMEAVTQTAGEITQGAYERRVAVNSRFEEIKRLGLTFNTMLDRIQTLLRSMKETNDNIAHDLRSPLARIRGVAEMTLVNDTSIDHYRTMAADTMEECDNLIELINTMLDITEAEAGVNGTQSEIFDLVKLAKKAVELFHPVAAEKHIELTITSPKSFPFYGAQKKMQRIVTNLLENAIKYTPNQGLVSIAISKDSQSVRIAVTDTGVGISEAEQPHIFKRFYRCDQSRSQGGSGLGLSLAKAYVESMNGSIHVESTTDKGSTFTLVFDAQSEPAHHPSPGVAATDSK